MIGRTSTSHPLQIATIDLGDGLGSLGLCFCPGKKQLKATTGPWDRDLQAIADWNAPAVVTLVEQFELNDLNVPHLGQVIERHMEWLHLHVVDVSVPDAEFEKAWITGASIRATLHGQVCGPIPEPPVSGALYGHVGNSGPLARQDREKS